MPLWRTLFRTLTPTLVRWALLMALAPAHAAGDPLPSLPDIGAETASLVEFRNELEAAAALRVAESERLAARLAQEEETLRARNIRPDMLRAARLQLDETRQRADTLAGQSAHRRAALTRLEHTITVLTQAPDPPPSDSREALNRVAALELLRARADALNGLTHGLDQLIAANRSLLRLYQQRLRLLQTRIRLDIIDDQVHPGRGGTAFGPDPRVAAIQAAVTQALRAAARLANAASAITGDDPDAVRQRQDLEAQAQDWVFRANIDQNDLELLSLRARLDDLSSLREDPSMPVTLLRAAAGRLQQMRAQVRGYATEVQTQRRMLATRHALAQGRDEGSPAARQANRDLATAIDRQEQEVRDLRQQVEQERTRLTELSDQVYADSLTERHPIPMGAGEWRRTAAGAAGLPALLVLEFRVLGRDFLISALDQEPAEWATLLAGGLLVMVLGGGLSLWLGRRLVDLNPARRIVRPARALAAVLPGAIPAALWTWIGARLELPANEFVPVLLLLGIWPVSAFVLKLTHEELFTTDSDAAHRAAREVFSRRLHWGLVLAALVATLYVLTRSLPVSPLVGDVLDRLAMIGLLLLAVPAFGLHDLILPRNAHPPGAGIAEPAGRWARVLGGISRLIALALVAAGVLGLLGYANLAWAITIRLGWLALVAALLFFAIGALGDLRDLALERLSRQPQGTPGEFWQGQFVTPGYRLAVLLASLAAASGLLQLWGWNSQSPPVHALLGWAERPLFQARNLSLTPWDLGLAALLVAAAILVGNWVNRVSFQLAYARVRDRGLRKALAGLSQYLVILIGVLLALKVVGLDLTTLMVFAASLGVGIGFGLQNIVNNFISGVLLLVERPLRVGDVVAVGPHQGEVTRIGIRSLTIRTFDKEEVFIPNGTVISGDFVNWTRSDDILRTVLAVGISYHDDPDRASALIREILAGYEPVLRFPAPEVYLWEFGDSAVLLRVEYCVHFLGDVTRNKARSEVNRRIWYGLKAAGITIPYPQRDLHVRMIPDGGPPPQDDPTPAGT